MAEYEVKLKWVEYYEGKKIIKANSQEEAFNIARDKKFDFVNEITENDELGGYVDRDEPEITYPELINEK